MKGRCDHHWISVQWNWWAGTGTSCRFCQPWIQSQNTVASGAGFLLPINLGHHWPNAMRYSDVQTVGKHNLQPVHIIAGGFPCQDISIAGKGSGLAGKRSGLFSRWPESFANFNPESGLWRRRASDQSLGDWMPFLDRWPKSGLMQCGETYRLDLWVPPISVIGGSVLGGKWATPQAFDAKDNQRTAKGWEKQRRKGGGMPKNLREEIQKWSTPFHAMSTT